MNLTPTVKPARPAPLAAFLDRRYSPDRDTSDHEPPFVPSPEDWAEVARWRAATGDPGHALEEETPAECLDDGADWGPWWLSLPTHPSLDTPVSLPETDLDLASDPRRRASRATTDEDQPHYRYLSR